MASSSSAKGEEACLCVFDIDRTLTTRQRREDQCPGSRRVEGVYDDAYSGGTLVLSALGAAGFGGTFCGTCFLGVCSAGDAGGDGSSMRRVLVDDVLVSGPQRRLAELTSQARTWSHGGRVTSPLVVGQPDKTKQHAVADILAWYGGQGIRIPAAKVHFFGDRTENIGPFLGTSFNAREISCGSRDASRRRRGKIGYCGATPGEVVSEPGVKTCSEAGHAPSPGSNPVPSPGPQYLDSSPGHDGGPGPLQACQGDCDGDGDCAGSLRCFQRSGYESVPGCGGYGIWGFDYCYDPSSWMR